MGELASFGAWLRRRRKALDLTQVELARRIGCAPDTIRRIEADERRPSRQLAALLADHLNIPPAERMTFLKAARAELSPDRLALPTPSTTTSPAHSPERPWPSGTVTFLFSDIEGSTRLWEQHPNLMPAALARYEAILQASIEAQGGLVFKTVGDAVCAAFSRAPNALAAAREAQRALQTEPWAAVAHRDAPHSTIHNRKPTIKVRMALHTGTVEVRTRRRPDPRGPAHRAHGAAHGDGRGTGG